MRHRFLTDPVKNPALRRILRTCELPETGNYYHEVLTPFQFTLMSIRPAEPRRNTLTILIPGASVRLPPLPPELSDGMPGMHHHNCFEFTYVLEGSLYQLVNGKQFYYPAGSCCLMNRNTLHAEEDTTDYTCVFLSLTEEFADRLRCFGSGFLFPDEERAARNPIFDFMDAVRGDEKSEHRDFLDFFPRISGTEQEALIHSILSQIAETLIDAPVGASFRLLDLMSRLISLLCNRDYFQYSHVSADTNVETLLLARIDRVLSQCHGRISNRDLADLLHYNGTYLGRIVKKHTGKSLFDYSMDFTMNAAAEQLRNSDQSVMEIASSLSFTNLTHFYSIFKKHFGITPGEYRESKKTGTP